MKYINFKFAKCLGTIFLMIIGVCVLTTNVRAQSESVFETQIPFDFVVKGRTFPAGTYQIRRLDQTNLDVLILKNAAGKKLSILHTQRLNSRAPSNQSKLTFHRYGDILFLDSIWASGKSYGSKLPIIKLDRERRRMIAMSEVVSLTGN